MAREALIEKNKKKRRLVAQYRKRREELKAIIADPDASSERKVKALEHIEKLPTNSSAVRLRNRCRLTWRPRGFRRWFGVSRIMVRELALSGYLPGIKKASW